MTLNAAPWHALPASEVVSALGTSAETGLGEAEAARRLRLEGPNLLPEAEPPAPWRLLLSQFASPLVYLLLVAAAVSYGLGDIPEAIAILVIVLLNAALGFIQEFRAERALRALRAVVSPYAVALRDGAPRRLPLADLVRGDVVLLEAGDVVPADGRLLEAVSLRTDEALLTGESTPVDKGVGEVVRDATLGDRASMVYQGTQAVHGRGRAVVVATGAGTEMGRIAALIAGPSGPERTPLQRRLEAVGRWLVVAAILLCGVVFVTGVARGLPIDDMFLTAASLAVAAIPEGLPAATTIVLALGVQRMARRQVIIRRLSAVETLGSATVVYADKTGTLTVNRLAVQETWTTDGETDLLRVAVLCNNATLDAGTADAATGDPTEIALLLHARGRGLDPEEERGRFPRLEEIPFEAKRARMTVVVQDGARRLALTKGAPEVVVPLCQAGEEDHARALLDQALETAAAMAERGQRVLAFAERVLGEEQGAEAIETGLRLRGIVAMADPLRPEAAEAVRRAKEAGVHVVMLTGDHPATAVAIGEQIGLHGPVLTGRDLQESGHRERFRETDVFARVTSEDKLQIVEAAREAGEIAAMTGDGVNDAPALRAADIGIAMGQGGTDVAREAADMVLLDNSFGSIVAAIEEGRAIFANIRRFAHFLLSCNVGEVAAVFLALTALGETILTPVQILFVNLLTDGLPALALGVEPAASDIMRRPPRPPRSGIITGRSAVPVIGMGGLVAAATLAAYGIGRAWEDDRLGDEMAFATLVCSQLGAAFVFRSETRLAFALQRNGWLIAAVLASLAALLLVFYAGPLQAVFDTGALSAGQWLVVTALAVAPFLAGEALKLTGVLPRMGLLPE